MTNLRKVLFKQWIPAIIETVETDNLKRDKIKDGTNCWEKGFSNEGLFHQWGVDFSQGNDGSMGNYTIALVEKYDGTIESVIPQNLKFID